MSVRTLLPLVALIALAAMIPNTQSMNNGVGDFADSGCTCHGAQSDATTVTVTGLPENFTSSTTYSLTLTVTSDIEASSDSDARIGGFRILADGGEIEFEDSSLAKFEDNGWTHTAEGHAFREWQFNWTAPEDNTTAVSFTFFGNAVNSDEASTGDAWNSFGKMVPGDAYTGEVIDPETNSAETGMWDILVIVLGGLTLLALLYVVSK